MLFITEAVPLPTVPLLIIIGEVVLLKVDPTKVAQSLMTDSVLFIMGSLMLAVAIVKQRLDRRIAWWIVRLTGTNIYWISFGITAMCGTLAAFIGEHTVAAMMLPVGVTLITLDLERSQEGAQSRGDHPVLDLLWMLDRRRRDAVGRRPQRHHHQLLEGLLLRSRSIRRPSATSWITCPGSSTRSRCSSCSLPIVAALLMMTFKPETTDMSRAVSRLRTQVMMEGPLKPSGWLTIAIFVLTILGWIFLSERSGPRASSRSSASALSSSSAWCAGRTSIPASTGASSCSMRRPFRSASR